MIDLAAISNDPSGKLFEKATRQIICESRVRTVGMSREAGAQRYILLSSYGIYGFQEDDVIAAENSRANPLTT